MPEEAGCCPDLSVEAELDIINKTGSAKVFLERIGLFTTRRRPRPRFQPDLLSIHTLPLQFPLPLPEVQLQDGVDGTPPPDRGRTQEWHTSSSAITDAD